MWYLLLIPAAIIGAIAASRHKTATSTPAQPPAPPQPTAPIDPVQAAAQQAAAMVAAQSTGNAIEFPDQNGNFTLPGAQTVDGHGTGVLFSANNPAAQQQAAAIAASELVQRQGGTVSPEGLAIGTNAQNVKDQIIQALNTPQTDRTPEQLALLLAVASLPEFRT